MVLITQFISQPTALTDPNVLTDNVFYADNSLVLDEAENRK